MTDSKYIEELLHKADAYGLRTEVIDWAKKEMEENPKLGRADAYELAYRECVK